MCFNANRRYPSYGASVSLMNACRIMCAVVIVLLSACTSTPPTADVSATPPAASGVEGMSASDRAMPSGDGSRTDVAMALIPEGEFRMGSMPGNAHSKAAEGPQRIVYLDAYYIDVHEVRTKDYAAFLDAVQPEAPKAWHQVDLVKHGNRPVVGVTWEDATAYCRWVGKRLPTEAEWEKAARGTDGRQYPWGDEAPTEKHATLTKRWQGYDTTTPVGSLEAGKSPYGLYDMAGNAMEWVSDWYDPTYYASAPVKNPQGPETGKAGIVRGGGWGFLPQDARTARRIYPPRETRCTNIGFRCARDAVERSTAGDQSGEERASSPRH